MKKTNVLLWSAALACMVAAYGCSKANNDEPVDESALAENVFVIHAVASDNDSKAQLALDGGAFSWTATSDKIAVATSAGYKASAGATGVDGDKATFTVDLGGATLNTNAFALYPHTLVMNAAGTVSLTNCDADHDGYGDNLVVHLPDEYTIGEVTSPKIPCPMIAENVESGAYSFKQLCAILCVQVNSIPASAKSLVFDFNGKKVSGEFEIASPAPGTSSIVAADDGSYDTITITGLDNDDWTDGLIINLPVPTGVADSNEFTNVTVTAKDGSTPTPKTVLEMTRPIKVDANWVPSRATRRKIVASLPAFSVSAGDRIAIAASNLYYDGSAYSFDAQPYTIIKDVVNGNTDAVSNPRDVFTFDEMHDVQPTSTAGDDGTPKTFEIGGVTWRQMSLSEWDYMCKTRGGSVYSKVILPNSEGFPSLVNYSTGTPGVFLFPDNWVNTLKGASMIYNSSTPKSITRDEYDRLIAAGAIFLPYTGARLSTRWDYIGRDGQFWSTSRGTSGSDGSGFALLNYKTETGWGQGGYRAVRLVRNLSD